MLKGVDHMHQVSLFLTTMYATDVANQDTSSETVPLMEWVEEY